MANVFVKAGRWLAGAWNGYERKNPSTGAREYKHFGDKGWTSAENGPRFKPFKTNASQHPKPPKQLSFRVSRPVGVGARIGVGEGIGTLRGTPVDTNSPTSWFAGSGGMIGMRIAGSDEVAEEAVGSSSPRGGAGAGSSSGS